MGVTGLWTILQPCARPIKLETLNKKRLAVDASIWIYQFLKAVRDKEGNALRNSHVVGFFRRICKLLFYGIKPVFVFDGGAPALKRQTISTRKRRREGRREDAVRTAGKLLAVQMQRLADEEAEKRKQEALGNTAVEDEDEEAVPENPVYAAEVHMSAPQRYENRKFKKSDAYHLPDLNGSLENMATGSDPRIMSQEELEDYARQFHSGEDINLYDFSKIDFNSSFFLSLPAADRYNILNAARLRSRLRMGYSKDQLDSMFQNRMEFSRFQIDRVRERNELTQRLMNINGMNGEGAMFGVDGVNRVAGEKGREYVLVKNDGVEGGWALGVVTDKNEGKREKPIDVDAVPKVPDVEEDDWEEEDAFEDVPIEGLNRLPKRRRISPPIQVRQPAEPQTQPQRATHDDSLFVSDGEEEWENALFGDGQSPTGDNEEEDLRKAIAMSLEEVDSSEETSNAPELNQQRADEASPFTKASGRSIAQIANDRSNQAAPVRYRSEQEKQGDPLDFQSILTASRRAQHKKQPELVPPPKPAAKDPMDIVANSNQFGGPLPFEKLSLGPSLFSKKSKAADQPGGFEKPPTASDESLTKPEENKPLPPWFAHSMNPKVTTLDDMMPANDAESGEDTDQSRDRPILGKDEIEIIDVDALDQEPQPDEDQVPPQRFEVELPQETIVLDEESVAPSVSSEKEPDVPHPEHLIGSASSQHTTSDLIPAEIEVQSSTSQDFAEMADVRSEEVGDLRRTPSQDSVSSNEFEDAMPDSPKVPTPVPVAPPALTKSPTPEASPITQERGSSPPAISNEEINEATVDPADSEYDYSDPEDEELFAQLAAEADEHARFAASLNTNSTVRNAEDYERELRSLRSQQKKDRRDADEVTQIMITECQQLLKLFGLPYITAPMEAEAQCAELVRLGLVDGIVTDDSDVFLFGGTRIYKNMFNQAKFVECYLNSDLEKEFTLDRERLIRIAHLLGSDYTEGLPGVGPVTALEIVSEFEDLDQFREWWTVVQSTPPTRDAAKKEPTPFRRKFRKNAARIFLPAGFPDVRVDQAYLEPEVDSDPSAFAWGVPDLASLRDFLMATIGWSAERTDEVLLPVIRDMNSRAKEGTQSNITNFFKGSVGIGAVPKISETAVNDAFAPRRRGKTSKRMQGALGKLKEQAGKNKRTASEAQEVDEEEAGAAEENPTSSSRSSRPSRKRAKKSNAENAAGSSQSDSGMSEYID